MSNLKTWLEEVEERFGELIEAIVVGKHYDNYGESREDENIILSREAGLKKLDGEFDDGFGGADCYPFVAWTASRVFFVQEYDGATNLAWVPRNPIAVTPEFSGIS
jgi:hypothetical protein